MTKKDIEEAAMIEVDKYYGADCRGSLTHESLTRMITNFACTQVNIALDEATRAIENK